MEFHVLLIVKVICYCYSHCLLSGVKTGDYGFFTNQL